MEGGEDEGKTLVKGGEGGVAGADSGRRGPRHTTSKRVQGSRLQRDSSTCIDAAALPRGSDAVRDRG